MSRVNRAFPQQSRTGGHRVIGESPPQVVLPLPTLAMQTVTIHGVAVKVRVAYPRRFVKHYLYLPARAVSSSDSPTGSAAASGTVAEAARYADTQQSGASPTGSLVENTVTGIGQPFIEVMLAGNRRGRVALRSPLVVTSTHSTSDVVSGGASASGARTEALTHAPSLSGSASPTGTLAENFRQGQQVFAVTIQMASGRRNVQSLLKPPATVQVSGVQQSDIVSGRSSASGSLAWAEIHTTSPSGTASPSGFSADSFGAPGVARPVRVVSLTVEQSRSYRWKRRVESILFAPAVVNPPALPLASQRTIVRKLAGATRAGQQRRQVRHFLSNPNPIGAAVYADNPSGTVTSSTGSVVQALTHAPAITGSAAPAGSVVQAKVYGETVSGSAAATGSKTDVKIGNDLVSGASSATGSSSDSFHVGSAFSDNPSGTASPTGSRVEARIGSNTVSGSAASFGSIVERKLYPDALLGTATSVGFLVFANHLYPDAPQGAAASTGATSGESFVGHAFPVGFASATGRVAERQVDGYGDTTFVWRILRLKSRWTAKVRS